MAKLRPKIWGVHSAWIGILALASLLFPLPAVAQQNHPEITWRVLETEHFHIYYYAAITETAACVARAAEEVFPKLAARYGGPLTTPVRIVLDDTSDPLNGAAYHDYNLFGVQGVSSVSEFRGAHLWLGDVVAHEMAHLYSLRRATMLGKLVPGIILSGLDAPSDRSFQAAATLFLPNEITPRWFAEGIAQADSAALGIDRWDTHRDMLLRASILERGTYDLDAMGALTDKNYLQAEKVYNQGFDFLRYLNAGHGELTGSKMAIEAGTSYAWDFTQPMSRALNRDAGAAFAAWKADRESLYGAWLQKWAGDLYEGEPVAQAGFLTRNAAVSPDGKYLVYTGNGDADFSSGELYLRDISTGTETSIAGGVGSQPAWAWDSKSLLVSADSGPDLSGNQFHDLFRLAIPSGDKTRLTRGGRAEDPALSADGKWVAASVARDGARNLTIWPVDSAGKLGTARALTRFGPGYEVTHARFNPAGTHLVFSVNAPRSSDLWMASVSAATISPLTQTHTEEIEPYFLDATTVAYIGDERGAFDLYTLSVTDGARRRLTTTIGGAFTPSSAPGWYYYLIYHDEAFGIYRRPLTDPVAVTLPTAQPIDRARFAADVSQMTQRAPAVLVSRPYYFDALPLKLYPEILYADRTLRAGATLAFGDVLNKHEFELEVLLGENQDYHAVYKNHQLSPDLVFDVSHYQRRNHVVKGLQASKLDFSFDGAVAGVVMTFANAVAIAFTQSAKRIDFGYPIDRELERGLETAFDITGLSIAPNASSDINPTDGSKLHFRVSSAQTRVFEIPFGGSILDGKNKRQNYWSWSGDYTSYIALPGDSTIEAGVTAGYLTRDVGAFDELFLGGRIFFLRQGEFQSATSFPGYEEFSLSGEKLLLGNLAYRFPLWRGHTKMGPFTASSVYFQPFADAGNVLHFDRPWKTLWQKGKVECPVGDPKCDLIAARTSGLLQDAGAEVRLKMLLFDSYPWNSFARVAYGFQEPRADRRVRGYLGLGIGF